MADFFQPISGTYEDNRKAFVLEVVANIGMQDAIALYIKTKVITTGLQALMVKWNMLDFELYDLLKEANVILKNSVKKHPQGADREQAIIEHGAHTIEADLKNLAMTISLSKEKGTTGVWRWINRGGSSTVTHKAGSPQKLRSHVFAIRWDRIIGGRGNTGVLTVAFRDGGRSPKNWGNSIPTLPIYSYSPIGYDEYYELWKRIASPGRYVYNRWAQGGSDSGYYVGQVSISEVMRDVGKP